MLINANQVAARLGVHPSTIRRWIRTRGGLPKPLPVKAVDGGPLWLESDVERWRAGRIRGALPHPVEDVPARLYLVR